MERIDAHHHLWRYRRQDYGWIDERMAVIARDFLPGDLRADTAGCGIDGAIAVQARHTVEETAWLLEQAAADGLVRGVVGWAPLASREFPRLLESWKGQTRLKGLRHIVQDEPDGEFLLREDFNAGIRALRGSGLIYDILIYEGHLPAAMRFVDRHPDQVFVLDHIAKPRIRERLLEPWRRNLLELGRRGNVFCKLSGMVTEADWSGWTVEDLRPYAETALEAFGPARLMFGSDWPVCLLASDYRRWLDAAGALLGGLHREERDAVFGGVAKKVYSC
jgi:L-fuconolactonase